MKLYTFKLGVIRGVTIQIDITLILMWLVILYGGVRSGHPFTGFLTSVMVFGIVLCHEFGHILAAEKFGYRCKLVTLSMVGGCAEIGIPRQLNRWAELIITACGPLVNLVFAAIGLSWCGLSHATFHFSMSGSWLDTFTAINISLLVFNLLPIFPMDGGRMLRSGLRYLRPKPNWRWSTRWACRVSLCFCAVFLVVGIATMTLNVAAIGVLMGLAAWGELKRANTHSNHEISVVDTVEARRRVVAEFERSVRSPRRFNPSYRLVDHTEAERRGEL